MDAMAQGAVSAAASATLGAVRTVRSFGGESLSFAKFGEDVGKVRLFLFAYRQFE
jgi:ATP-binding cassette subfamily B (MDR/TAP) protein 8